MRRNAATRGGVLEYRATVAQWKAELAAKRPKTAKLAGNGWLQAYVQSRLAGEVTDAEGRPIPGPNCHGEDGGMVAEPTGGGESVGVLSRSAVDCG
ncbi:hypothetical protein HSBAA_PA_2210 (plasmid) [Vreelandella sulfidaeris]|uniref:Uncharacterized protein n=1 Tax=Vreelandella sulfidaeris TaxID=115553 RepID=A0A455UMS3_9GAMM|nr:hypothetical protein HSBAA_PA_2210 [Halomonas sulfidaeris]